MSDICLFCEVQPVYEISVVLAFSIAFRAITMAIVLIALFNRLRKTIRSPSLVNLTFSFLLVSAEIIFAVQVVEFFAYPLVILSIIWNILIEVITLPYVLAQIYLLSQFETMMMFPTWLPKALAGSAVILHIALVGPMYYYEAYYMWKYGTSVLLPLLQNIWIVYIVVLDVVISVSILRAVVQSVGTISNDEKAKAKLKQLTNMVIAMLLLDLCGLMVSVLRVFHINSANQVCQLFASNDIAGLHLVVGTTYLGSLMKWVKEQSISRHMNVTGDTNSKTTDVSTANSNKPLVSTSSSVRS